MRGAIGLTVQFTLVSFGLGIVVGILAAICKVSPIIMGFLQIWVIFVSTWIVARRFLRRAGKRWLQALRLKPFDARILPPLAVAAVGMSILFSELGNLLEWFAPSPQWLRELFMSGFRVPLTGFLTVVIVVPIAEEMIFRGLMLGGLLERYRARAAVLVSAALFMAYHLNPYQFVIAMVFGVLSGWLYVSTRSLWPCMIGHGLTNLVPTLAAIGVLPWTISRRFMQREEGAGRFQPLWLDALGAALAALGLLGLWHVLHRRHEAFSQDNR
jgi:hypothetical protein